MTIRHSDLLPLVNSIGCDLAIRSPGDFPRPSGCDDDLGKRSHADHITEFNSVFQAPNSVPLNFIPQYPWAMTWDQRLSDALRAKGWSKTELARRSGVAYDNVLKYVSGKVDQPRGDTLDKLADALDVERLWLSEGLRSENRPIPLMGFIGAGAEIEPEFEQVPPEGLDQIHVPFPVPDDMIAFGVRGDSMLPVFKDGAVVIVYRDQKRPLTSFFGEDAAVRTSDGRRFIKTIMRGGEGLVNLFSWNAAPIENVSLEWIGEIFAVLPPRGLGKVAKQGGIQGQFPV